MRAYDWERAPIDVETPEVVPARVMKGMVMVREPVSEKVGREEPKRVSMREKILVSEEELDVVPRMEMVRRRVLAREDWAGEEPRRGVVRRKVAEVVERADEVPESETSPKRDKSPYVMEVDGIVLVKESMV